jgi:hypothetical protein
MKTVILIMIVSLGIQSGCTSQSDIGQAVKNVETAYKALSQPDAKKTLQIILNEKHLTDSLSQNIDGKNSNVLSKQKEILITECSNFIDYATDIHNRIIEKHKTSKSSNDKKLMHERFVNEMFIENNEGSTFRNNIENLITKSHEVTKTCDLKIRSDELPIKLNYDIVESGISWEETVFKGMPAGAVLPIINKFKRDAILTKILILEEISKTDE